MKASSAHRLLPFETFGEAAAFDLEVEVSCQCGRCIVIDGMAPAFRDRRIMGTRFRCTTIRYTGTSAAPLGRSKSSHPYCYRSAANHTICGQHKSLTTVSGGHEFLRRWSLSFRLFVLRPCPSQLLMASQYNG